MPAKKFAALALTLALLTLAACGFNGGGANGAAPSYARSGLTRIQINIILHLTDTVACKKQRYLFLLKMASRGTDYLCPTATT